MTDPTGRFRRYRPICALCKKGFHQEETHGEGLCIPTFAELRERRTQAQRASAEALAMELNTPLDELQFSFDVNACFCACPDGPCEHDTDGPVYNGDSFMTTTCSKCGQSTMSHDLRFLP